MERRGPGRRRRRRSDPDPGIPADGAGRRTRLHEDRSEALSEGRNETASAFAAIDHANRRVRSLAGGGFVVEAQGATHRVLPAGDGWRIEADDELNGWRLQRSADPGFVLLPGADGGAEAARTMSPVGIGPDSGVTFLLLGDGRLFRIALRGPRDARYELTGWETTGAYLTAQPDDEEWRLRPTSAAGGIEDIRVLCLMLAVGALDADGALGRGGS
jgi:hypothetical protein